MQIHKIVLTIIDFDEIGAESCREVLENTKYPNRGISPKVHGIETREIGQWHDEHPLNYRATSSAEITRLFQ
jgi:hypothetical protein